MRRAIWRHVVYSRYREGLETRNVLIVGAGRVAALEICSGGIDDSRAPALRRPARDEKEPENPAARD